MFSSKLLMITAAAVSLACGAKAQSYGPYPQQTYVTCGSPSSKVAVELIHGGAWVGGSDDSVMVASICQYLGQHGVYVVSINYRLSGDAPWPAQLQDAQLALRWMRATLPATRFGVLGTSAGGHMALSMGLASDTVHYAKTDPLDEASSVPGSDQPDFVVDVSGPTDLTDAKLLPQAVAKLVTGNGMKGGPARAYASPIAHLSGILPPTLISHGIQDDLVPVDQSSDFVSVARQIGIPIRLTNCASGHAAPALTGITYDRHPGKHVFGVTPQAQAVLFAEIATFVKGH